MQKFRHEYDSHIEDNILRAYDGNPPDDVVLSIGGCPYCAMTGYEDYPSSNTPCRLGHVNEAEERYKKLVREGWKSPSCININFDWSF